MDERKRRGCCGESRTGGPAAEPAGGSLRPHLASNPWAAGLWAVGILAVFLGGPARVAASEEDWAKAMFDHTSHNFGMVARGAKVEHRFPFKNLYLEDVHISAIHSTCRCVKTEVTKKTLKTHETSEIVVTVDTRKFTGRKDATLKVVIDQPFPAEVQLHAYTYIRKDVVVEPGEVRFGTIPHGTRVGKKLSVSHAGRSDWRIIRVERQNPRLDVRVIETGRNATQVSYDVSVELAEDAPVGYVREHLVLVTNDLNKDATRVLIAVEGIVTPAIAANPSPVSVGHVRPGESVTKNLVVHAKSPFKVVQITVPDSRFRFLAPTAACRVQLIPVTFTAGSQVGPVTGTIQVQTDLAGAENVEVEVTGQVVRPEPIQATGGTSQADATGR